VTYRPNLDSNDHRGRLRNETPDEARRSRKKKCAASGCLHRRFANVRRVETTARDKREKIDPRNTRRFISFRAGALEKRCRYFAMNVLKTAETERQKITAQFD